jgi:Ca2+-binding RTX toxin-like protein
VTTYTHLSLDMDNDNNIVGGLKRPFFVGTYTYVPEESTSTDLVYTYELLTGEVNKCVIHGSGLQFSSGSITYTSITGMTRYDTAGLVVRDEITDFLAENGAVGLGGDALASLFFGGGATFYGFSGVDLLYAGDGNSIMYGYGGDDTLQGGNGFDIIYGGTGNDLLVGGPSAGLVGNRLYGQAGADDLRGTQGNDRLYGGSGNDYLYGNGGRDIIDGGTGADHMEGGTGNDIFYVDNAGDILSDYGGYDIVRTTVSFALTGLNNASIEMIDARQALVDVVLLGNNYTQKILGGAGSDTLTVYYDIASVLDGGAGDDVMTGSYLDDVFYVDSAGDVVNDYASLDGSGYDRVYASVDYSLAAGQTIEALYANAGSTGLTLTGNEVNNRIYGGDGDDVLAGGAGADVMRGGSGHDQFYYASTDDSGKTASTRDKIFGFVHGEDIIDVGDIDAIRGTAADNSFIFKDDGIITAAGQIRAVDVTGGCLLEFNTGGTLAPEMRIFISGGIAAEFSAADFML